MPRASFRDIALELSEKYNEREMKLPRFRGEIVQVRQSDGQDSIHVEGRPGYVWVRVFDMDGSVMPLLCRLTNPINEMPVTISRMPGSPMLEVISFDDEIARADANYDGLPYLRPHHLEHEWPDGAPGIDAMTVYPRAWSELKTYQTNPTSLSVNVSPLRYYYQNTVTVWNGGSIDLTARVPAGAGQARLVLVYLNPSTNTLGSTAGAIGPAAAAWALDEPTFANNIFPSAVVRLENGQTAIIETDIRDRKFFLGGTSTDGWPFTRVITVDPDDPDADYTTIQAAVNAATHLQDVILISPNVYAGFTCAKTLTFVGTGSLVDINVNTPHTWVNTAVTLTNDYSRFVGIAFTSTITIQNGSEFTFCGFEGTPAIQSNAVISIGTIRLISCYVEGNIDLAPGAGGLDLTLVRTSVDGNIDMDGNDLSLWSTDIDGTVSNVGTRTNLDGPHIQRTMRGPEVLVVGTEGAQYATFAAAIAAAVAGDVIYLQSGDWTCDAVLIPDGVTVIGDNRETTVLQTTTTSPTLTLGDGSYIYNATIKNEQSSAVFIAAVRAPNTGSATLQDCLIICNNTRAIGLDSAYGTYMDATYNGDITLIDTDITTSTASAAGWSLAAYANQNAIIEVHGGRLDAGTVGASTFDAYAANVAGATVNLYGAVAVRGNIGVAGANGTVQGWRYDLANNLWEIGTETNYSEFEADGTLEFVGAARVWNDIYFPMTVGKVGGANQPTWTAFQGNTYEYTFAINDYIHLPAQEIPHSYDEGTDIKLHVHIVLDGSDVADTVVNYEIEYTIGDINEVMSGAAVITSGDYVINGATADRTHLFIQIGTIVGTTYLIQAALKMRFRRIANIGGVAPTNDPFVLMVGAHIEEDTIGSRLETTK